VTFSLTIPPRWWVATAPVIGDEFPTLRTAPLRHAPHRPAPQRHASRRNSTQRPVPKGTGTPDRAPAVRGADGTNGASPRRAALRNATLRNAPRRVATHRSAT
jgi:hypothetical protein